MNLFNSLSNEIEEFQPEGEEVGVYVCGITPYDTTHLGHAFTYSVADVLIRYLRRLGYPVRYVQNVTDIDDDILRRAESEGTDWRELGDLWTARFIEDMIALNIRPPDHFPRATEAIPSMMRHIADLIGAGVAYVSGGGVYFEVDAWDEFGKLSKLDREEMLPIANERGNHPDDPNKRDPLDFVLWQPEAPNEPSWPSPWGPGRPGWHIECSTMATELLGGTVDIHIGGSDLLFPHHECEIAQVEPLTEGGPFGKVWMHTAMVEHQGEKMSKSLGNLIMARDLLDRYDPDVLRLYLASHHYRKPWEFSRADIVECREDLDALVRAMKVESGEGAAMESEPFDHDFERAMSSDLDTPTAIGILLRMAVVIVERATRGGDVEKAQESLRSMSSTLGLVLDRPDSREDVTRGWQLHLRRFRGPRDPSG